MTSSIQSITLGILLFDQSTIGSVRVKTAKSSEEFSLSYPGYMESFLTEGNFSTSKTPGR